jgi:hypothetical protein
MYPCLTVIAPATFDRQKHSHPAFAAPQAGVRGTLVNVYISGTLGYCAPVAHADPDNAWIDQRGHFGVLLEDVRSYGTVPVIAAGSLDTPLALWVIQFKE